MKDFPKSVKLVNLKNIAPKGWLLKQLQIQAASMTGKLDEFWPDVKDSSWFGGSAEGWERAPYWLDGFIPLAYLLKDEQMIAKVTKYLDYIITHQHADGWLGPKDSNVKNPEAKDHYDIWAQFLILKVLCQYHDITGDDRAIPAVTKGLKKIEESINWTPLFDWGQARWFEALISISWLYSKTKEHWLLDLATKLQAQGFNWQVFFEDFMMKEATKKGNWNFMGHVVNNAMAIKAYGVVDKLKNETKRKTVVDNIINTLDKYHGTAVGTFSGDECLAGREPNRGTELCAIVEYMYSLEKLIEIYGDAKYADRLETIAFNALPAAFTKDMWAHQYDEQINQVQCSIDKNMPWSTNDLDANIFGLAPHFGCCTSNYHQGFPKFAAHQWMQTEDGLLVAYYAPSEVTSNINGINTTVNLSTDYPFKNTLTFTVSVEKAHNFALYIRVPTWCKSAHINECGKDYEVNESGYIKIQRQWENDSKLVVTLQMDVVLETRLHNAIAVKRGPLVFAMPITYEQKQIQSSDPLKQFPHCDYEFFPTEPWNYALNYQDIFDVQESFLGDIPFDDKNFAVTISGKAKLLSSWKMDSCVASSTPESPVNVESMEKEITLVPFACTMLRIAEFPYYVDKP